MKKATLARTASPILGEVSIKIDNSFRRQEAKKRVEFKNGRYFYTPSFAYYNRNKKTLSKRGMERLIIKKVIKEFLPTLCNIQKN